MDTAFYRVYLARRLAEEQDMLGKLEDIKLTAVEVPIHILTAYAKHKRREKDILMQIADLDK